MSTWKVSGQVDTPKNLKIRAPFYKKPSVVKNKSYKNDLLIVKIEDKEYCYPLKAGIILFDSTLEKVLMVKTLVSPQENNVTGKWGVPKGHKEENETLEECAMREFYEETGIKLNVNPDDSKIRVNNTYYYPYVISEGTIMNRLRPMNDMEISNIHFVNIDIIRDIEVNKETFLLMTKKLKLSKKLAISIDL